MRYNRIMTIGHSTRKLSEMLSMLSSNGIDLVADIRTIPRSRHNPQFNQKRLKSYLARHGIGYVHIQALGGLRHAKKDSLNLWWRNASFRGFADYMQTKDFRAGLQELLELSKKHSVVIMCAEALPWRCHRSLVSDALIVKKVKVYDIMGKTSVKEHRLTPSARLKGKIVTYP